MKVTPATVELIKKFEGFAPNRYKCPAGVWTIGYGHTGEDLPLSISLDEAEEILRSDITRFEIYVSQLVTVPLTDNQFGALVSFCFNLGPGALKASTLLRKLNAGDYAGAANEFPRWCHAGGVELAGLKRRREAEKELFLS